MYPTALGMEEDEKVGFACRIALGDEESMQELRRIRIENFEHGYIRWVLLEMVLK